MEPSPSPGFIMAIFRFCSVLGSASASAVDRDSSPTSDRRLFPRLGRCVSAARQERMGLVSGMFHHRSWQGPSVRGAHAFQKFIKSANFLCFLVTRKVEGVSASDAEAGDEPSAKPRCGRIQIWSFFFVFNNLTLQQGLFFVFFSPIIFYYDFPALAAGLQLARLHEAARDTAAVTLECLPIRFN